MQHSGAHSVKSCAFNHRIEDPRRCFDDICALDCHSSPTLLFRTLRNDCIAQEPVLRCRWGEDLPWGLRESEGSGRREGPWGPEEAEEAEEAGSGRRDDPWGPEEAREW